MTTQSQCRLWDRDALPVPLAFPRATQLGATPSTAKSAGCFLLVAPSGFALPLVAVATCHHLVISTPFIPSMFRPDLLLCSSFTQLSFLKGHQRNNYFFSSQKIRNIVKVQLITKTVSCLLPSDRQGFRAKQRQPMRTLHVLKTK